MTLLAILLAIAGSGGANLPTPCDVGKSCAPAVVSAESRGIGARLTVKVPPWQRLKPSAPRRIADKVVRLGDAAKENKRLAIDDRRIVETRAKFGAHVGRIRRVVSQPEAAAGHVGLAVGRRIEVLELNRTVGRDTDHGRTATR